MRFHHRLHTVPRRVASSLVLGARKAPWVVTTVAVSLLFLLVAAIVSANIGIPIRDPEGSIIGKRMMLPFMFMGLFIVIDCIVRVVRSSRANPDAIEGPFAARVAAVLADRWWWQRTVVAVIGFSSFSLTYLAYRNLKGWVSLIDPLVSYDARLSDFDRRLTFGHMPAKLLQDLLGTGISAHVLSTIYLAFIPFVPISVAATLAFSSRIRDAYVYVSATCYCWILGTISYYMLPSRGPFDHDQYLFRDLPPTGVKRVQDSLISGRLHFHSDPLGSIGGNSIGSIGAFASLHVGVIFMGFLVALHFRKKLLAVAMGVILIPITVSTSYFGWHYLADDFAGLFIGWFAYVSALWTVYPKLRWLPVRWRRALGDHREHHHVPNAAAESH